MGSPVVEDHLLKKIQELEAGQAQLKQEMSKLIVTNESKMMVNNELKYGNDHQHYHHHHLRSQSVSPQRTRLPSLRRQADDLRQRKGLFLRNSSPLSGSPGASGSSISGRAGAELTGRHWLNILQSMGHSVHVFDLSDQIIYWNRAAEILYGYSASEALGQDAIKLVVDARDLDSAIHLVSQISFGENWSGQVPAMKKSGERFTAIASYTSLYDDDGGLNGIICVSNDIRPFQENTISLDCSKPSISDSSLSRIKNAFSSKPGGDSLQPLQAAIYPIWHLKLQTKFVHM